MILQDEFDLVLMDMQMPVLDGIAATRELRERGVETPIVALTANAMRVDRQQCLDAGCNGYLTKPFQTLQLLETIEDVFGTARPAAAPDSAKHLKLFG